MSKAKTLGQVAYENDPRDVVSNWGPWDNAPAAVQSVYELTASAVEKEVLARLKRKIKSGADLSEFWKRACK